MTVLSHDPQPATGAGLRKLAMFAFTVSLLAVALNLSPATPPPSSSAVANLQEKARTAAGPNAFQAANAFLDALEESQKAKAQLEYGSDKKPNWSNLPVTMVPRNGVRLGDLAATQRDKAMALLAAVLSKEGYRKVLDIVDADQHLADAQREGGRTKGGAPGKGGRGPMFGKDNYYLALFGRPSEAQPWMIQFGGHHLGLNVTVIGKHFILTPTHTGTQPARFTRAGAEVRPLGRERAAADKLMASLDESQRSRAVIGQRAQGELLLGPGRDGKRIEPKGLKGSALSKEQQALLMELIAAWVDMVEPDAARIGEIKQSLGETYFAWSGPTEVGKAAYFRVQGPRLVIEYAPQGGTDHIHTVIRDPEDDYGVGELKK